MATQIIGFNIRKESDPTVDKLTATGYLNTPLVRLLTTGTDLDVTNRITATDATGNNTSSANIRISSGKSTGTAAGGNIIFQISSPGSTGSSLNAFTDVTEISYNSFAIKDASFSVDTDKFTVAKDTGNTSVAGTLSVGSNLTVTGNLTVNGTTTTVNSTTISVDDKNIELGNVTNPNNSTANDGGIILNAGTDIDKTFKWLSSTTSWTSSENIDLLNNNTYKINGVDVLTSTQVLGRTPGGTTAGDIATIDASQTLTNKSLSDSTIYIVDNNDATKRLQFEVGNITAGQTRTLTVADLSGTIALIDTAQTFTASHTFRNTSGQRFEQESAQDGIILTGRAGGTNSYDVTIIPDTLTADRILTLPNVTGTVVTTGDTGSVTNTMLFGSIENEKLVNSSITINGVTTSLGGTATITSSLGVYNRSGSIVSISSSIGAGNILVIQSVNRSETTVEVPVL